MLNCSQQIRQASRQRDPRHDESRDHRGTEAISPSGHHAQSYPRLADSMAALTRERWRPRTQGPVCQNAQLVAHQAGRAGHMQFFKDDQPLLQEVRSVCGAALDRNGLRGPRQR